MASKEKDVGRLPLREALNKVIVDRLRHVWLSTRLVRAVFIPGAAAVAGVCQYLTWEANGTPTTSQIVGIFATVVVCVAAIIAVFGEQDATNELLVAQRALHSAEDLRERLEDNVRLFPQLERMVALLQVIGLFRDHLETAWASKATSIDAILSGMLTLVERQLPAAAGYSYSDQWTICIYRAVHSSADCRYELTLIEHLRAIKCDKKEARTWKEGIGVAGVAFANQSEIVIDDLSTETASAVFKPKDEKYRKGYDTDRYRSIVAVPIMVQGLSHPWGMVSATSAKVGHFNHEYEDGLKAVEAIRAVARFAALAVAGCAGGGAPPPAGTP